MKSPSRARGWVSVAFLIAAIYLSKNNSFPEMWQAYLCWIICVITALRT